VIVVVLAVLDSERDKDKMQAIKLAERQATADHQLKRAASVWGEFYSEKEK